LFERKDFGLPLNSFVFCNFNQLYKITPKEVQAWSEILRQVPNSVLWLLKFPAAGERNLKSHFAKLGVNEERIVFTDLASKEVHLSRIKLADLCLDTFLCSGHTTTSDLLWAGLPIITLFEDQSFCSRVASSLVMSSNCKLSKVCKSVSDYITSAVDFANGKRETTEKSMKLFDHLEYVSNYEKGLQIAWENYSNEFEFKDIHL